MTNGSVWEMAHGILGNHFKGLTPPLFFGNEVSPTDQTEKRGKPRPYIFSAMELIKRIKGRTIVEVGCMRQALSHPLTEFVPRCCNDGHSTAFWGSTGLAVHSVDINASAVKIASFACESMPNVKVTCADGIDFLKAFPGTIDLLYLDAWDAVKGTPYAEMHEEAFDSVRDKLSPSSIVPIDDTDMAWGGKGRLAIPASIRAGFELLLMGRQTLLMRLE